MIEIVQHKSSSYAPRTYYNASVADLTLAISLDFTTAGERLTKKAAGEKYLPLWYHTTPLLASRIVYAALKKGNVKTLNIAGNGIYTFFNQGIDQNMINERLYEILSLVHQHYPIQKIISGGQTGMDIAAAIVAEVLNIPCTLTYPKGIKMRFSDGTDVDYPEEQLKSDIKSYVKRLTKD